MGYGCRTLPELHKTPVVEIIVTQKVKSNLNR